MPRLDGAYCFRRVRSQRKSSCSQRKSIDWGTMGPALGGAYECYAHISSLLLLLHKTVVPSFKRSIDFSDGNDRRRLLLRWWTTQAVCESRREGGLDGAGDAENYTGRQRPPRPETEGKNKEYKVTAKMNI